jgi:hypothetical protein
MVLMCDRGYAGARRYYGLTLEQLSYLVVVVAFVDNIESKE